MLAASLLWNRLNTSCDADVSDVCVIIELQGKADGIQGVPKEPECFRIRGIHHNINYVVPLVWKGCKEQKYNDVNFCVQAVIFGKKKNKQTPLFYFLALKLKVELPWGGILQGFHKRAKLFLHKWSHWPFLFSLAWVMRFSSLCSWIDKTHLYLKACRNLFNSLSWVYLRFDEHQLTGEPGLEIRTKLSISRTVKVTRKAMMIRLLDISIPYKTGKRFTL